MIFGFALVFNLLLIPSWPTLSDDMFRYIWDGRVQAAGFSPYRYPSNAAELEPLRDEVIWPSMNRPNAVTIYPPAAQMVFAFTWRLFPDSVTGMKVVMIGATLLAGWLLVHLLQVLNQSPARALIFLWNPLLIFEVAHAAHVDDAAHVDALYLPLLVGAFLLRARAPSSRVSWRYEAGIGLLLGLATLMKLYPAMLAVPLWSLVDDHRRRHWRLMLPVTLVLTVLVGYALYFQPGVNSLGFLSTYGGEFFNISPLMRLATDLAWDYGLRWQIPGNVGMPLLVIIASLYMVARPARTARSAILRCFIGHSALFLAHRDLSAHQPQPVRVVRLVVAAAYRTRIVSQAEYGAGLVEFHRDSGPVLYLLPPLARGGLGYSSSVLAVVPAPPAGGAGVDTPALDAAPSNAFLPRSTNR